MDPVLGPVTLTAVLLAGHVVEIAAYATDPDYWRLIEDDPDD